MSAYSAARHYLHRPSENDPSRHAAVSFDDSNVTLIAVGDGVTPRTATLFAFRSRWRCVSIDPALRPGPWHKVASLTTIASRVQDAIVHVHGPKKCNPPSFTDSAFVHVNGTTGSDIVHNPHVFSNTNGTIGMNGFTGINEAIGMNCANGLNGVRKGDRTPQHENAQSRAVVVMWHAHVSIRDALSCISLDGQKLDLDDPEVLQDLRSRVAVISCACCNYDEVQQRMPDGSPPDAQFEDTGVPGLMRTVRVWKFVQPSARDQAQ